MKITVFGDSVTYGGYIKNSWFNLLRDYWESTFEDTLAMYNLGVNGNTSRDILSRFNAEAMSRSTDKIIFAFGVNDSAYLSSEKEPVVSQSSFQKNLTDIFDHAKKYTHEVTFIGLVLGDDSILQPYPESSTGELYSYSRERVVFYDNMISDFATKNECQHISLFQKLLYEDFSDGLHPNESGHRKMFEEIKTRVKL